jgi:hypothetical protein
MPVSWSQVENGIRADAYTLRMLIEGKHGR